MITYITIRDSQGRIKTFFKNQDFSSYETFKWQVGKGIDGRAVTYLVVGEHFTISLSIGTVTNSFTVIHLYAGDMITLEDEHAPVVNLITALGA